MQGSEEAQRQAGDECRESIKWKIKSYNECRSIAFIVSILT